MVSAQGYEMPQAQLPQSQTAAIPVDGGFTVGDAIKKKRIAEALRAKVSQDYEQQSPTGHAAANGNFPGETYINYGNILQNAMQPWLEGRREKKAAAAEDEADSSMQSAVSGVIDGADGNSLTMKQAIELGRMTGKDYTGLVKKDPALGALLQGYGDLPAWAVDEVTKTGGLSRESLDKVEKWREEQAEIAFDREAELKRLGIRPVKAEKPALSLEEELRIIELKAAAKKKGEGFGREIASNAASDISLEGSAKRTDELIAEIEGSDDYRNNRAISFGDKLLEAIPAGLGEPFVSRTSDTARDRLVEHVKQLTIDASAQFKGQGAVSDYERNMILDSLPRHDATPEVMVAALKRYSERMRFIKANHQRFLDEYNATGKIGGRKIGGSGGTDAPTVEDGDEEVIDLDNRE